MQMNGFMRLLMKRRNNRLSVWTKEDKRLLRKHLLHLSLYIPILAVFALPFGSFLFPVLAEIMDRRKQRRHSDPLGDCTEETIVQNH